MTGDAMFISAATGDYRVRDGSPALKLGFRNFPTDQFGVVSPALKKLARRPRLPKADKAPAPRRAGAPPSGQWLGATVQRLAGQEMISATGMSAAKGVVVLETPKGSAAMKQGLRTMDVILKIGGRTVTTPADLPAPSAGRDIRVDIWRNQQPRTLVMTF